MGDKSLKTLKYKDFRGITKEGNRIMRHLITRRLEVQILPPATRKAAVFDKEAATFIIFSGNSFLRPLG